MLTTYFEPDPLCHYRHDVLKSRGLRCSLLESSFVLSEPYERFYVVVSLAVYVPEVDVPALTVRIYEARPQDTKLKALLKAPSTKTSFRDDFHLHGYFPVVAQARYHFPHDGTLLDTYQDLGRDWLTPGAYLYASSPEKMASRLDILHTRLQEAIARF
jgi:hypothetical protein